MANRVTAAAVTATEMALLVSVGAAIEVPSAMEMETETVSGDGDCETEMETEMETQNVTLLPPARQLLHVPPNDHVAVLLVWHLLFSFLGPRPWRRALEF